MPSQSIRRRINDDISIISDTSKSNLITDQNDGNTKSQTELQAYITELENQIREMKEKLADFENKHSSPSPTLTAETSSEKENNILTINSQLQQDHSPVSTVVVTEEVRTIIASSQPVSFQNAPAVVSSRIIPLPPPLPYLGDHDEYDNVEHIIVSKYSKDFAPPLPTTDKDLMTIEQKENKKKSNKAKKAIIEPKVPMRSLFWTRIPDDVIYKTIFETISDENVILNVSELEQQFCKAVQQAASENGEDSEQQKELLISKKEKNKDISLLDSKG
jgi:hypothetical protein